MNPCMHIIQESAVDFFQHDTPHGYVKRFIWKRYLQAFVAKTQNAGYKSLIYDGFAGAGLYSESLHTDIASLGSPLIAIHVSIEYLIKKQNTICPYLQNIDDFRINPPLHRQMHDYSIQVYLVEANITNFQRLVENVQRAFNSYGIRFTIKPYYPLYVEVLSVNDSISVACRISHNIFQYVNPPILNGGDRLVSLIDPFGYTHIPMSHVEKFVGPGKEIFINFMSQFVNRFFDVNNEGMQSLFGMEKLKIELDLTMYDSDRLENAMALYKDTLKTKTDAPSYALSFEMRSISNNRLYHMIFLSCHEKGFEAMKEAMNRGSQREIGFSISDFYIMKKGQTLDLTNGQTDESVAEVIFERFENTASVPIDTVRHFVLHETLFLWRKGPLKVLCQDGRITNVVNINGCPPSRRGTFPDHTEWFLTFAPDLDVDGCTSGIQQLRFTD